MTDRLSNPKRSAPTSDPQADLGTALVRLADTVADLQKAATRGLPPRFSLRVQYSGDDPDALLLVDEARNRQATIPLNWEPIQ